MCIEGRGTLTNLSKTCGEVETRASHRKVELQLIEEEREHSVSREPSMAEREHRSNSNKSGSEEETKEDSISRVSLGCWVYALGVDTHLGFCKNGI